MKYFTRQEEKIIASSSLLELPFSSVAFGVGTSASNLNGNGIRTVILEALRSGVRHFDLAEMYGNHLEIGKLFHELWGGGKPKVEGDVVPDIPPRNEIFITSKIWTTNMNPIHVHQTLLHTLKELQLEYLDAWLIHWPVPMIHTTIENPSKGRSWPQNNQGQAVFAKGYSICDTWLSMEKEHEIGLVKHLGVSNFSPSLLHMLLGCLDQVHPIINQVEVHPYNPQQALFRFCQNNNITMQAYSPLAGGGSIGEYNLFQERSIVEASENHRVSPAEILFAWSLQRGIPFVSSTKRIERIKPMLASKNIPLTKDEMKRINDISFRHRFGVPDQFKFLFL